MTKNKLENIERGAGSDDTSSGRDGTTKNSFVGPNGDILGTGR